MDSWRYTLLGLALLSVLLTPALGTWQRVSGGLKHVTTSVNYVWGVNSANQIFRCTQPCTGSWTHISGGLQQIDASDEEVWGVISGQIYKRPVDGSGSWQRISGSLKHVSASGNGYVWGVNSNDHIFKCKKPCSGSWLAVDGRLSQIDAGYDYVYGVNCLDDIFERPVDGSGTWRQIPGKMRHVTAGGKAELFGVNDQGQIFRCRKPCLGNWERIDGGLSQCDASIDEVFGVTSTYRIYKRKFTV